MLQYYPIGLELYYKRLIISSILCGLIVSFLFAINESFMHWFLIPIWICGSLVGVDALDWINGKLNIFDPIGIIGLLGFHFFFLAPLLHVYWNYWMEYVVPPPDWRDWLGLMSLLNAMGIIIYNLTRRITPRKKFSREKIFWQIKKKTININLCIALSFTALLQILIYIKYGGIFGYIAEYESRKNVFEGMGFIFMLSEKFPILALILYIVNSDNSKVSWQRIFVIMIIVFILSMIFGGLRGSRSNVIWSIFWAIGIIHLFIRPLTKKIIFIGIIFLISFMYIYGFYKAGGLNMLSMRLSGNSNVEQLEDRAHRSLEVAILGDLARSDVQAFLLYKYFNSNYKLGWGSTYLGALTLIIPKSIWSNRPTTKVEKGTDLQYGIGTYSSGSRTSSRIYSLAGEALLNFGIIGILILFALFGYIICKINYFIASLHKYDARWFLVPFLINICVLILVLDSDNIVFVTIKNGLVPFLVILLSTRKYKLKLSYERK